MEEDDTWSIFRFLLLHDDLEHLVCNMATIRIVISTQLCKWLFGQEWYIISVVNRASTLHFNATRGANASVQ